MRKFCTYCLCLMLVPLAARADWRYFDAEYRIYAAGILFAKVELQLDVSETDYRLSAHIAPALIGRLASNTHVIVETRGRFNNGAFVPQKLDLNWVRERQIKTTYMRYQNGAPTEFVSAYQPSDEQLPVVPVNILEVGSGTLDPFTARLLPISSGGLNRACDDDIQLFDGRRRAALQLVDPTPVAAAAHDYPARIDALACSVLWTPIAGYSKAALERAADLPPVKTHYGRIADTPLAAPLEMRGRSKYGNISIYAVRFFTESDTALPAFNIADYVPPASDIDDLD